MWCCMQVAAGGFHAAALTHDGEVYTWGRGSHGALGHGGTSKLATPKRVAALRGVNVQQVCVPGWHVCVLFSQLQAKPNVIAVMHF
jgi:alpha-tubulin suppressor-like RCC1 family protein